MPQDFDETSTPRQWSHLYAWLGGVLILLAHSAQDWPLLLPWGWKQMHPWHGHMLIETRIITELILFGGLLGGWWWWAAAWKRGALGVFASIGVLLFGAAAFLGWMPQALFYAAEACWMASGIFFTFSFRRPRAEGFAAFLKNKRSLNAAFAFLFVAVNTTSDAMLLVTAPPGWIASADFVFARLLTHIVAAAGVWLLLSMQDRWMPRGVRWLGRAVVALLPLFVLADTVLQLMWSKGLFRLFAELEVGGEFQWRRALEAGGVEITPMIGALGALCVAAALGLFVLCSWISRRAGWRINPRGLMMIGASAWILLQAEQGADLFLKSRAWCWWERKACDLRYTPIEPKPGWVSFDVEFADSRPTVTPHEIKDKPEVFLFIVETFRADALRPDVAPFLCRWRDAECQQLGETVSASNATQLSWFSIMSGRLPMYWEDGRSRGELALLPSALHAAGYRVEARMVSDFSYMDIVRTNFGTPPQTDYLEFVSLKHPDYKLPKPEREIRMIARLRDAVEKRPADGSAWITAFDAPHYPYLWPASFTPPLTDFEDNPMFPLRPTQAQIDRIVHRYWNSVAWVDQQMAEFTAWLKTTGRYDNAIIILTGDHGEEFKEHGSWFHCSALNPQQTHVPILIKWPTAWGRGPAQERASHLDLAPTLLSALHCPDAWWQNLPGHPLLKPTQRTTIINTTYESQNGEAMLWQRHGWQASFGWPKMWESGAPHEMWLERLQSPTGPLPRESAADYERLLRRQFPDVFGQVVTRLKVK